MYEYFEEVKLLKSLTHPARLAVLEILRDGEQCVCHIESILQRRQAYISQQLMVLRDAGLLKDRRLGLNIYYRVVHPEIYSVLDATRQMSGIPAANLVHISGACTCPSSREHDAHR